MKKIIIVVLIVLVVFIVFDYLGDRLNKTTGIQSQDTSAPQRTVGQQSKWEAQTDEQGAIVVQVKPLDISATALEWKFEITMDTHSVQLDTDMIKAAVLVDDSGKKYAPLAWEGDSAGGHHRQGILKFKTISPKPKTIILKITGIDGAKERIFQWELAQ